MTLVSERAIEGQSSCERQEEEERLLSTYLSELHFLGYRLLAERAEVYRWGCRVEHKQAPQP